MTWHELVEAVRAAESSGIEVKRGELDMLAGR